jgi:Heterokaryon incompatibility protein (HET)
MRLLNVSTLQLEEFIDERTAPPYAILSHTWGKEEVTYEDMRNNTAKQKFGYQKVLGSCAIASQHELAYIWIDTCTIDKSSSAELSEAINSMFRWYLHSTICITYLEDCDSKCDSFTESRWLTRGWTLQELIAPGQLVFYSKE